jgi:hypothetical protein
MICALGPDTLFAVGESPSVTIVSPTQDEVINSANARIEIEYAGPVSAATFQITLNEVNYRLYFFRSKNKLIAPAAPLFLGDNHLVVKVYTSDRKQRTIIQELDFQAAPKTLKMKEKFLIDVPLFQDVGSNEEKRVSLTYYLNVLQQKDFKITGNAQLLKIDGNLLIGGPDAQPFEGQIINDQFFINIDRYQVPYQKIINMVEQAVEEETGQNPIDNAKGNIEQVILDQTGKVVDLSQYTASITGDMPIVNLELSGTALDADQNGKAEALTGIAKASFLYGKMEVPYEGSFDAKVYEKLYDMSGGFGMQVPFFSLSDTDKLNLTFYLEFTHRTVELSGKAYLLLVNDHILTDFPPPVSFSGAVVDNEFAVNLKVKDIAAIPYVAEFITENGLSPEQIAKMFDLTLVGTLEGEPKGKAMTLHGQVQETALRGIAGTPPIGDFLGTRFETDGFSGGRIFQIDSKLIGGPDEPIQFTMCVDVQRSEAMVSGDTRIVAIDDKPVDFALTSQGAHGVILDPTVAITLASLTIDDKDSILKLLDILGGYLGKDLTGMLPEKPELTLPDSVPDELAKLIQGFSYEEYLKYMGVNYTLIGTLDKENLTSSGEAQGTFLWGMPLMTLGSYETPVMSQSRVSGKHPIVLNVKSETSDGSGEGSSGLVGFDLTLRQNGCMLTGTALLTKVNGVVLPAQLQQSLKVRGTFYNDYLYAVIYEMSTKTLVGAGMDATGSTVNINLYGPVTMSGSKATLSGDVRLSLLSNSFSVAVGTYQSE